MHPVARVTLTAVSSVLVLHTASGLLMPLAIGFCLVAIARDRRVEHAAGRHPTASAGTPLRSGRIAFPVA